MEYVYDIRISAKTEAIFPGVKRVVDSINETMGSFGFPEKLTLRSELACHRMTISEPLNAARRESLVKLVNETYGERFPEAEIGVEVEAVL